MKKIDTKYHFLKYLKIYLLSFSMCSLSLFAASQDAKLTLNMHDVSIKKVFEAIEAQSEYSFLVRSSDVDLNQKVTVEVRNKTVFEVLNNMLISRNISYTVKENRIVIYKKEKITASVQSVFVQKDIKITGTVSDNSGVLMPGVNVIIKGTTKGTTTDINGEFTLTVPSDTSVLQFRFIGYKMQETVVGNRRIIAITLSEETTDIGEVVVVGFGKQKKEDLVGSVVSINTADLKKVSSSNVTAMLAGNIAGMISYQRSGEPGADNADFFIRGVTTFGYKKDPLILIDGIEVTKTDLARMQPDDIANFSIMKDATSTAVYGARGANGVIAITTKEGSEGQINISVRFENAFTMPAKNIELADPITYMRLGNEAVLTRDPIGTLPYSRTKIDNTVAGTNKYVYPATDWQNEMFRDFASSQRLNLNASGGGKVARYYLAATVNQDNGNLKVDKRNNFNSNIKLRTYSFRSNINFNLTKTTEAALRLTGSFDDYTGPVNGGTEVYRQVMHANPVLFPPYYAPDAANATTNHILFGNYGNANYINPYAEMVKGYKDYSRTKIDAQFELEQDFSFVVEGLSLRGLFNTSRYSFFDVVRFYNPFFYNIGYYDRLTDIYTLAPLNETDGTEYLGYREGTKEVMSSTYIEIMGNYNRTFAERHTISGMLVFTTRNSLTGNAGDLQLSLPHRNLGLSGRATYSYRDKYYGEFNFGYNGSERFYKTHRYGFFPSAGVAWTISKEDFWQVDAISKLKLRATYGFVGNDAIGSDYDRFYYLSNVNMNSGARGAQFGVPGSYYYRDGVQVNRNSNENITWEVARKTNIGFEFGLFDKFSMEADYFREHRGNILMDRASIPTTMGLTATERANVGEAKSHGIDGSLDFSTTIGSSYWLKARVNFTYATSEFLVYEEPKYKESYRQHVGLPLSQLTGLIAERLFIDEPDVTNSPVQTYGSYMAGDIKYHDVNGDGKITDADAVPIGYPTSPEVIYGFGISAGYKNIDFSCFFQGSARSSFWINASSTSPFSGENQLLKAYADSHWSEDNQDMYALWPRLSTTQIGNNIMPNSTWFMRNGAFLRLKSLEIGYTLPSRFMQKIHLSNARFYLNGTNLFCFSKFKLWDVEMGGEGLGYPIQKSYNIGVTVSF
ncbi:MAG: TonB-dependent receptor [Bacteroidales bacterium]|jgi:TonB-linked SusC/RagA family outer membrane protein|nr:TonB-dependent receptor [Bacteroidales bacterium]